MSKLRIDTALAQEEALAEQLSRTAISKSARAPASKGKSLLFAGAGAGPRGDDQVQGRPANVARLGGGVSPRGVRGGGGVGVGQSALGVRDGSPRATAAAATGTSAASRRASTDSSPRAGGARKGSTRGVSPRGR